MLLCPLLNFFFSHTVQSALAISHNDALAQPPQQPALLTGLYFFGIWMLDMSIYI